eukprot:1939008-Rhodomonas_salina.1
MIRRAAPRRWAFKHETQMSRSTLLHSPAYTNWRPNGLAYDPDTDTIMLLEFTRCSDSRHDALLEAVERKEIKYQELLDDLRLHNTTL